MRVVLTSTNDELYKAWTRFCGDLPNVEIFSGSILDAGCEAVVSPENSFGFMDGGLDDLLLRRFGRGIQERVQGHGQKPANNISFCTEKMSGVFNILMNKIFIKNPREKRQGTSRADLLRFCLFL